MLSWFMFDSKVLLAENLPLLLLYIIGSKVW